jgi:hypothetical protein
MHVASRCAANLLGRTPGCEKCDLHAWKKEKRGDGDRERRLRMNTASVLQRLKGIVVINAGSLQISCLKLPQCTNCKK